MTSHGQWWDVPWGLAEGCTPVSEGCEHCWAAAMLHRFGSDPRKVRVFPERLEKPLHWRNKRRVFVAPRGDLFHDEVPGEFIRQVFQVAGGAAQHSFLFLTKRPRRMAEVVAGLVYEGDFEALVPREDPFPWPNLWLGVTAETQARWDERTAILREIPAAVHWVSVEPCLGAIDCGDLSWCDWMVVGGETGAGARPMHPQWPRGLRDRCAEAGVPFFFKGWGEWGVEYDIARATHLLSPDGSMRVIGKTAFIDEMPIRRVGRKAAGRLLDGKEHNEWPKGGTNR